MRSAPLQIFRRRYVLRLVFASPLCKPHRLTSLTDSHREEGVPLRALEVDNANIYGRGAIGSSQLFLATVH